MPNWAETEIDECSKPLSSLTLEMSTVTREDIFVHRAAIARNNPQKIKLSVGEGATIVCIKFIAVEGKEGCQRDRG